MKRYRCTRKTEIIEHEKIVWRRSTFSQNCAVLFAKRFLLFSAVRFPSRSRSEISVLKTLHFQIIFPAAAHLKRRVRSGICIYCDRLDARFYFLSLFIRSIHTMATGTSNTEIDDLKEMVRVLTNRVDILSASNTDLNTNWSKRKS